MSRRTGVAVALGCAALVLSGCGSEVTSGRLEKSVSGAFSHLLVLQQGEAGLPTPAPGDLRTLSSCRRGPAATGTSGAGEDWSCVVSYSTSGGAGTARLEVQARPDGCWQADGAPSEVGPPTVRSVVTGRTVTNPLTEFDGCFDTGPGAG